MVYLSPIYCDLWTESLAIKNRIVGTKNENLAAQNFVKMNNAENKKAASECEAETGNWYCKNDKNSTSYSNYF